MSAELATNGPAREPVRRNKRGQRTLLGMFGAVLLAVILIVAFAAPAFAFPDVPSGHPYQTAINDLSDLGIIGGYTNGNFGLNDSVKRAQFAKMIVGALGIDPNTSTDTRFTDLGAPDSHGYPHVFVQTAYDNGITYGTNAAQTLFAPYNAIRRDQVVSMIVRGADNLYPGSLATPPPGTPTLFAGIPEPHGDNLRIAEYNGILDGLIGMGSNWDVSATATRGEVAQMLWNLLTVLNPPGVTVNADGSGDYPTLEAAVADIDTGTTIYLGPGTYHLSDTLLVDFSFNLIGSGMDGPNASVVTCPKTVVDVESVTFGARDVKLVSTSTSQPTDVLDAADASINLNRCYLIGATYQGDVGGRGVYLGGNTDAIVAYSTVTQNDLDGISCHDTAQVLVEGCTLTNNGQDGVNFWDTATGTVAGNLCNGNAMDGIALVANSDVLVDSNLCATNGEAGINFDDHSTGIASNNECRGNRWGLYVGAGATPVIQNNNSFHDNTTNVQDNRTAGPSAAAVEKAHAMKALRAS